jgi:hypothetical protein
MPEVKVIIPSFRRSHLIYSHKVVEDYIVCIPEADYADYVKVGVPKAKIVCHPDNVLGLCPKRNWIFKHLQKGKPFLSLDDDIHGLMRTFTPAGQSTKVTDKKQIHAVIDNTAQMAEDIGAKFFGFANSSDIRTVNFNVPFGLTGFINGWSMGFMPGHTFEFPNMIGKEDYEISLQNAFKYRICFRNNRYGWNAEGTFKNTGGLAVYRNNETEKKAVEFLQQRYGSDVVQVVTRTGFKTQEHVGYQKVALSLPF